MYIYRIPHSHVYIKIDIKPSVRPPVHHHHIKATRSHSIAAAQRTVTSNHSHSTNTHANEKKTYTLYLYIRYEHEARECVNLLSLRAGLYSEMYTRLYIVYGEANSEFHLLLLVVLCGGVDFVQAQKRQFAQCSIRSIQFSALPLLPLRITK